MTMPFFRSSILIKSWVTRGEHYKKIQGKFHQKTIGGFLCGERDEINMQVKSHSTLAFNVRRSEPELVRPAQPTPNRIKVGLSDIDNQPGFRFVLPMIMFYPGVPDMKDKDPAKVIRNALAEVLVYYYPWAGRLRELTEVRRLEVDCTAEGVLFGEADADISLEQFGEQPLLPPYPYLDKLLYNAMEVVGCPMLTIQVTRLSCGGFIIALFFNHVMSDGVGIVQFLTALTEFTRGASSPSVLPVWQRNLLNSHNPRPESLLSPQPSPVVPPDNMVRRIFSFNANDVATLRARIPPHLQPCTAFELISAALWGCRTIALEYEPNEEVHLAFPVNIRRKFNPPLPNGYYGNAAALAIAVSPADKFYNDDDTLMSYAVEQVKKGKETVTEEYKRSLIDPGILRFQHLLEYAAQVYMISDASRLGLSNLDFGWGKSVYSGPADNSIPHLFSFITEFRNEKGEEVKFVSVHLPECAMDRFTKTLEALLRRTPIN